ncbi:MAG: hypothetical protein MJK18_15445, partial [Bdellovibrionales bacterium]|nr:hypothetical protein [Bdellovibrionales bacterium]
MNIQMDFKKLLAFALSIAAATAISSCGSDDSSFVQPSTEPAVFEQEETDGGCDLLSREFDVECDTEAIEATRKPYNGPSSAISRAADARHDQVMTEHPHEYSSRDKEFPLRGSWRQTKAEILDIVDRYLWSPEEQRPVELMQYFDMVLLINVAPRTN